MIRRGTTILEVLLAILILGGAIAVLGEFSRNSFRNAKEARDMTQAELLAESILAKVRIGIIEMESVFDVPITNSSGLNDTISDTNAVAEGSLSEILWQYTLEITNLDDDGLIELAVTVRQNLPEEQQPAVCRLVRWFVIEPETEETAPQ
ncbi:MAG: type II secretion system GspH family protein [Planctomycetaceae bacterium]|nr:type II secretion system GspH family protein [Planctomycetaceae bacterium]